MSIKASGEVAALAQLTPVDYSALLIAALLATNVVWRLSRREPHNSGMIRANLAQMMTATLGVSVFYQAIDPLLGGRSLLNCFTHVLMVYACWEVASAAAHFLMNFDGMTKTSFLVRPWVPIVSAAGVVGSYLVLNPASSRGLEDYDTHPAFVIYWASTLLPLLLGGIHLIPRLVKLAPLIMRTKKSTAISMLLLAISLAWVPVSVFFYAITAVNQDLWATREIVVTGNILLFVVTLLMTTAAIPRATGRATLRHRREETPVSPQ